MTPDEAADLAARTCTAMNGAAEELAEGRAGYEWVAADRERVASDLAGLRARGHGALCPFCCRVRHIAPDCPDACRYADGLARTARLYGVTP